MKKFVLAIFSVIASVMVLLPAVNPVYAADPCKDNDFDDPIICGRGTENDLMTVVGNVLNAIYGIIAIIAVVMIVIAGIKYSTSQGDPGKVQSAKNTILYAIIGLVITISAFAITNFILGAL